MYQLGAILSPPDARDYVVRAAPSAISLPAAWDYRGMSQMVRDQGREGTCVAHAVSSGWGGYAQRTKPSGAPYNRVLGIRSLYTAARLEGGLTAGEGCHVRDALKVAYRDGINLESDCPYNPYTYPAESSESWKHKLENKVGSYASVALDVSSLKTALYYYGPIVVVIPVFDGFWVPDRFGKVNKSGTNNGLHAVTLSGWSDSDNSFILRNSWGLGWALQGHCLLPFNDYPILEAWSATPAFSTYTAPKPWYQWW